MNIDDIIDTNECSLMRRMLQEVWNNNSQYIRNNYERMLLEKIIEAMCIVDSKFFVNPEDIDFAYINEPLKTASDQTISQPTTVARMLMLLDVRKGSNILEIGAGSGWNACLMAFLSNGGKIKSVDKVKELIDIANKNLQAFREYIEKNKPVYLRRFYNIEFKQRNFFRLIETEKKRYDRIIITAGIPDAKTERDVEKTAIKLLKEKGILVCPYTTGPLIIYTKTSSGLKSWKTTDYFLGEYYRFVPLTRR